MTTVNATLQDEAVRHAIALQQYSNGAVARMLAVLNASDARIMQELARIIQGLGEGGRQGFAYQRLEALLGSIKAMSSQAYEQMSGQFSLELQELARYEASYQEMMLRAHLPGVVHVASVSAEQVYAAAMARPFQGVLLRGVWADLDANKLRTIRRVIAQGIIEGQTTDKIIQGLRGTKKAKYADGILQRDRRDVQAVVRTAIGHTVAVAREQSQLANQDLIKHIRWLSTLDARTSVLCRPRDGKLYEPASYKPVGHKLPWLSGPGALHWQCRSTSVPVLKSFAEMGLDLPEIVQIGRTRAAMDGQVPAEMSYGQWLARQPLAVQVEVLGATRAKLMRDGKMALDDMYTQTGRFLTIQELRKRDAQAFGRAGLD